MLLTSIYLGNISQKAEGGAMIEKLRNIIEIKLIRLILYIHTQK
jgi:hypothetical protein